jgi:ankyrin repeat protein
MKINKLKAILSFIWLLPFLYKVLEIYLNINFLPYSIFNFLLYLSFACAFILIVIWFTHFSQNLYFKKAFIFLDQDDLESLNKIYHKIPKNIYKEQQRSFIKYAVDKQMPERTILYLLSKNDTVDHSENEDYNLGSTLFYISAYYNNLDIKMIELLLNKGAYVSFVDNSRGFDGLSVLHALILRGNLVAIRLLIKNGADLNYFVSDIGMNALMLACRYIEDPIIIKTLLEANVSINEVNKYGYNALLFASHYNSNPAIINLLVNFGAEIKPYEVKLGALKQNVITPLYLAVSYNNAEVVKKLIQLGDNIEYKDSYGLSILFTACANNNNLEVFQALIASGISAEESRDTEGNTPLMVAAYLNSNSNVIRYLLNKTHNVGTTNKDGLSFIDYIKQNEHLSSEEKAIIVNKWI